MYASLNIVFLSTTSSVCSKIAKKKYLDGPKAVRLQQQRKYFPIQIFFLFICVQICHCRKSILRYIDSKIWPMRSFAKRPVEPVANLMGPKQILRLSIVSDKVIVLVRRRGKESVVSQGIYLKVSKIDFRCCCRRHFIWMFDNVKLKNN